MKTSWAASPGTTQPAALLTLQPVQGQPPPPAPNVVTNTATNAAATQQTPKPDTSSKWTLFYIFFYTLLKLYHRNSPQT